MIAACTHLVRIIGTLLLEQLASLFPFVLDVIPCRGVSCLFGVFSPAISEEEWRRLQACEDGFIRSIILRWIVIAHRQAPIPAGDHHEVPVWLMAEVIVREPVCCLLAFGAYACHSQYCFAHERRLLIHCYRPDYSTADGTCNEGIAYRFIDFHIAQYCGEDYKSISMA
jgi:hypothetical protein